MNFRSLRNVALMLALGLGLWPVAAATPDKKAEPAKPGARLNELFPDEIIAKGKGVEIKRSRLDEEITSIKASVAARGQQVPPEHARLLEQQILDRLVQIQLLLTKANDADRQVGKASSERRIATLTTNAGSAQALDRQFKAVGTTRDDVQRKLGEEYTAEAVLERELKITVPDAEIKKFYDENPSKFEQPEMVRASHILLKTVDEKDVELPKDKKGAKRKLMETLLERARKGEDFAKLAKEYSEDKGSAEKGGEYTFGRKQMVPEFEAAAFSLKTNEVSDIITTRFGYHIIKLHENIPARTVAFEKVSDQIRDHLKNQQAQKLLPDYMAKLKKEADVQILDEKLKPTEQKDPSLPPGHPPVPGAAPEKKDAASALPPGHPPIGTAASPKK